MSKFGENVGGGRSYDERFGPLCFANVLDGGFVCALAGACVVPEIGNDFMAGKCCKSERLDEPRRRFGHDDVNFEGLPLQGAHQFRRFVSSDTAGDADRDSHGSIVDRFDCQGAVFARSGKPRGDL